MSFVGVVKSVRPIGLHTLTRGMSAVAQEVTLSPVPVHEVTPPYAKLSSNLKKYREASGRSTDALTLSEKIVYSHLADPTQEVVRGDTYLRLHPDRVAMQDASAQMALLQFMLAGLRKTKVPSSIHCDHLIAAEHGPKSDVESALQSSGEIFDFLGSAAQKYGVGFWKPGSGIIHQIVLENYAAPGALMLGTDSHTPNAGGLGMVAIGVGGADAVDCMAGVPWELKAPKVTGIKLTGKLGGWTSPKDVVLHLVGKLTVNGGTGHIFEYFGEGVESLSCTGMATICNMGAEMGATTSVFPYTKSMRDYLVATGRADVADEADKYSTELLTADAGADPATVYDRVVEINMSALEPHINGPMSPDRSFPLSEFAAAIKENNWPVELKSALIGSCTNSSYEDMTKSADIARQAKKNRLTAKSELLVTPGSTMIEKTIERDGLTAAFTDIGGKVLANACGPCIGQWKRHLDNEDVPNAIITSFNRNFVRRNDGNPKTLNFLAAPEITTAMAFAGTTTFNPVTDNIPGTNYKFTPPLSETLPPQGFSKYSQEVFQQPNPDPTVSVNVNPTSTRLQLLEPFPAWSGGDHKDMLISVKVQGKCTTDHISAAGPWLKYKGHLENIAENTLIGAVNDENNKVNNVYNAHTGEYDTIPEVMKHYKANQQPWMVLADHNYGEGSAREHAAMQVRFLGGSVVVARSFARIHETNLKKQGVLPLWLQNEDDYTKISARASVSTVGLESLAPGSKVDLIVQNPDQTEPIRIGVRHTLSADQIEWIRAGSALNMIAAEQARSDASSM
eukprot:CFRG3642T1